MANFTIDADNNLAAHAVVRTHVEHVEPFATERELSKLAVEWPGSRLVELWNWFAGVAPFTDLKPVKKFTDRKSAVARIWAAIQRLSSENATNAAPRPQPPGGRSPGWGSRLR